MLVCLLGLFCLLLFPVGNALLKFSFDVCVCVCFLFFFLLFTFVYSILFSSVSIWLCVVCL